MAGIDEGTHADAEVIESMELIRGAISLPFFVAALALASFALELPKAEFGHGLTAAEAGAGWISLFDGATTYGWTGAKVEGGLMIGGTTTQGFDGYELLTEFDEGGVVKLGPTESRLRRGKSTTRIVGSAGPIQFARGVVARRVCLRPLAMKSIFNGRDMTDWKMIHHPRVAEDKRPRWKVADGTLQVTGGPGALEYQGERFGDFIMQIDVRTRADRANSGVFFRSMPDILMNGYEAQIYNACEGDDVNKPSRWSTGAIDDRQNARRLVSRDREWFTMTVLANGPHISTWVNGHQQTDWRDTRAPSENPRTGLRVEPGTIQLQAHDPMTNVEFRNLRVAALK